MREKTPPLRDAAAPDTTAVRVALWRAMHVRIDPPPHVFEDELGLRLAAPDEGWRRRPDMDPDATRLFRAAVVARASFIEDLVLEQAGCGVSQYVLLGAGLDSFAQPRPDAASRLKVFEIDRAGPQAWKRRRLAELGCGMPDWLRFVPVDFEAGDSWWERLRIAGFDADRSAFVASAGVSMYLTKAATAVTLRRIAALAPGSTMAMSFLLPIEFALPGERAAYDAAEKGARASGTPFTSFFSPAEMMELAREAGFRQVRRVGAETLIERYFAGRPDGLGPGTSEALLVAST